MLLREWVFNDTSAFLQHVDKDYSRLSWKNLILPSFVASESEQFVLIDICRRTVTVLITFGDISTPESKTH